MTYQEAIRFLSDLQLFGAHLGLENTEKLAALAGNPQASLRFIHVAGTNGKGSTCAMLEAIYRSAGLRVGLFTSPHLVHFGERIQINREPINEADIIQLVGYSKDLLKHFPKETHPTFFEVVTVMALKYFLSKGCDIVIWETGLGGRLDATNIVTPLASVITNVQLDHQAWLGNTHEQIATEKSGIIKHGVPVITSVDVPGALAVVRKAAEHNSSPLFIVTNADSQKSPVQNLELTLEGNHQKMNALLAVKTVIVLRKIIPVNDSQIREGLETVSWPGRFQEILLPEGRKIILDGAHNIGGAESLRDTLVIKYPNTPMTLILGILADKDCAAICGLLVPLADKILLTPVKSIRSASPPDMVEASKKANPRAEIKTTASLAESLDLTKKERLVVIAGSLYLIGEAIELLNLVPGKNSGERTLNEWGVIPSKE